MNKTAVEGVKMVQNTENTGKQGTGKGEVVVHIKPFRVKLVRLILSVVAVVGSVLIITGGSIMLGISQSNVTTVGSLVYYHGLGLTFVGFGIMLAALGVGSCYRSLSGHDHKNG